MSNVRTISVNGRDYQWPTAPTVVICCDGSEPAYMEKALSKGLMPNLERIIAKGVDLRGQSVIPSFTNPNNLSIVTGQPPKVHGIAGNYFFDRASKQEVMMNDPKYLRASTIFEAFYKAGAKVAVVTAKDKLRALLGHGLTFSDGKAVCFSSEKADQCTRQDNGIEGVLQMVGMPLPEVYSLELSELVFAAGAKLMEKMRPDLMYLSTTDYIQHKYAPDTPGANAFYVMMDRYLGELDKAGAIIVLTADHGMKDKHIGGEPDVVYLQDLLDDWLGEGRSRVILPITDPYVVHHGALGSFATVYLDKDVDTGALIEKIKALPLIQTAVSGEEGCAMFDLPTDRLGDIIVVSRDTKVIGTSRNRHDLAALKEPLRSHGGITEQTIPIIVNRKVSSLPAVLHNYDAFAIGLNCAASTANAA
ncbi:MAG: phosphonoacetate hydrolase [Afipia felis]|nr:phosphonoacetate hydrolase [Afipia felis]